MLNKVILIGRVGKDPDIRQTKDGKAIANISLATSEKWTDKQSGEKKEKTEWHRVVVFGKLAEIVQKYVAKGSLLYIEGQIQTRKWEKDGVDQYSTEIVLQGFNSVLNMLGGEKSDSQEPAYVEEELDDEIPF